MYEIFLPLQLFTFSTFRLFNLSTFQPFNFSTFQLYTLCIFSKISLFWQRMRMPMPLPSFASSAPSLSKVFLYFAASTIHVEETAGDGLADVEDVDVVLGEVRAGLCENADSILTDDGNDNLFHKVVLYQKWTVVYSAEM